MKKRITDIKLKQQARKIYSLLKDNDGFRNEKKSVHKEGANLRVRELLTDIDVLTYVSMKALDNGIDTHTLSMTISLIQYKTDLIKEECGISADCFRKQANG